MPTVGWLFLLIGALLVRQVVVGRAGETATDIQDLFVAALQGDYAEVKAVTARKGAVDAVTAPDNNPKSVPSSGGFVPLLTEARRLGTQAKGYVIGSTGPTYYDCSGLLWRAMRNLGYTKVSRFTTRTFPSTVGAKYATKVSAPSVGDIVLWAPAGRPFGHMGVVSGPDTFYGALNSKRGILEAKISTLRVGSTPTYWRLKPVATAPEQRRGNDGTRGD